MSISVPSYGSRMIVPLARPAATGSADPVMAKSGQRPRGGEDSVSVQSAALQTIDDGMTVAREVVPTVEETQAEVRARVAQQREEQLAQLEQARLHAAAAELERLEQDAAAAKTDKEQSADPELRDLKKEATALPGPDARVSRYPAGKAEEDAAVQPPPSLDIKA